MDGGRDEDGRLRDEEVVMQVLFSTSRELLGVELPLAATERGRIDKVCGDRG